MTMAPLITRKKSCADIQEFGSVNGGFGPLQVHSLQTPDPLVHVLREDYFAQRYNLEVGHWIICTASCDKQTIEPALLIVVAADYNKPQTSRERSGAKGVKVALLSALKIQVPAKTKNGAS